MTRTENNIKQKSLQKNVVVVIPCFNAGNRLGGAVQGALAQVERVIVVDDGSTWKASRE